MVSPVRNPYIAGNPISAPEMFFGREDVFKFIQDTLIGEHQDNVIVLYGQRRTGKTSVLNQLPRFLAPRYMCIFVDLHGLEMDCLDGFLWELANYIHLGLRKNYQVKLPPLQRAEFMVDPRVYFVDTFLEAVWAAIGDCHVLLMLDEAIRLEEQVKSGKLEAQVFEYLRSLMQSNPRLNFLFSLGSGLEDMEKEYSFLFNVTLYKKISFLDRDSAIQLITEPVKDAYTVQPEAIEQILGLTSAHPYFTQLICHSLFNEAQAKSLTTITREDVQRVLDEAVERGMAVLRHVWDESTPVEKALLSGAAALVSRTEMVSHTAPVSHTDQVSMTDQSSEANRPVTLSEVSDLWEKSLKIQLPRGELIKAAHSLTVREVIVSSGKISEMARGQEYFRFTIDLQRLFIFRNYPPELVWEQIKDQLQPEMGQNAATPPAPTQKAKKFRNTNLLKIGIVTAAAAVLLFIFASLSLIRDQAIKSTQTAMAAGAAQNSTQTAVSATGVQNTADAQAQAATYQGFVLAQKATQQSAATMLDTVKRYWHLTVFDTFDNNPNNTWSTGTSENEWGKEDTKIMNGALWSSYQAKKGVHQTKSADTLDANTNFYIAVDVSSAKGLSENYDPAMGLDFLDSSKKGEGYSFWIHTSGKYYFEIYGYSSQQWTEILEGNSTAIKKTGVNRLAVVAQGDNLFFFINDQYVDTAKNDLLTSDENKISISYELQAGQSDTFIFDNFEIRQP